MAFFQKPDRACYQSKFVNDWIFLTIHKRLLHEPERFYESLSKYVNASIVFEYSLSSTSINKIRKKYWNCSEKNI